MALHELECRSRQLQEIEALEAVYGYESDFVLNEGEEDCLSLLKAMVSSCEESGNKDDFNGEERALCTVDWPEGTRAQHTFINSTLAQLSASLADTSQESCYELIQKAQEMIREELGDRREQQAAKTAIEDCMAALEISAASERPVRVVRANQLCMCLRVRQSDATDAPTLQKRVLIYFHHIIATGKRQACMQWAIELKLGGYSKIGWPGIVIIEGDEAACDIYVLSLKRLRWQHMEVRGEEVIQAAPGTSIDSLRRLHWGFEELDQTGMSVLADRCKEAGLASLFMTSLK